MQNQTDFVKGKAISDNIFLVQEMIQDINVKTRGGNMVLKLDITKAYDSIVWDFLFNILKLFDFLDYFINIVKNCSCNVWFNVMINGEAHDFHYFLWFKARRSFIAFAFYHYFVVFI